MVEEQDLRRTCREFVPAAFAALERDHVIPTSRFQPYVAVGRDYEGPRIMALAAYKALEAQLNTAYSDRFAEPLRRRDPEFATTYIFSLLEACVARCARDALFAPEGRAVEESIEELLAVLGATAYEVVCCRYVSHLTTATGADVQIGEVTVVPEPEGFGGLLKRIEREIPGARRAWNGDDRGPYDPPHALLIARETTDEGSPYKVGDRLSARIERNLLLARLLTAGTVQSAYEVIGTTALVGRMSPFRRTFHDGSLGNLVRRTVRLTGDEGPAFTALGGLIDAADVKREGMAATSFDVAVGKFNRSHSSASAYEHLVDLATALEAALIGAEKETEGLTLRLRSRVAALLATRDDPGQALFQDVGHLYSLRSKLVHGGQIRQRDLRSMIRRISTVPSDVGESRFGVALGYAVDRMRDVVRRAILARLSLAAEPEPLWPFGGDLPVDAILADDAQRANWRTQWRQRLADLGAEDAPGPPRAAVEFLSPGDR